MVNILQQDNPEKEIEYKRTPHQSDILPGMIKRRHIEDKVTVFGLDADLPTDNSSGISVYFATDTNKLYCYNGSAWVSTTLS